MPEGAVYVGRPTKWGNDFKVGTLLLEMNDHGRFEGGVVVASPEHAVQLFHDYWDGTDEDVEELRGKDLACWCALSAPCHADVLLEWANEGVHGD